MMNIENLPKWNLADLYDGVESAEYTALKQELVELTGRFAEAAGFDIESPEFWRSGITAIKGRVDEFLKLVPGR